MKKSAEGKREQKQFFDGLIEADKQNREDLDKLRSEITELRSELATIKRN